MTKKIVALGLQGGGSHGAFTWGVLDRLLEDGRIDIEAISGASAGAMNAAVLAHGYTIGGRDGARQALQDFWESAALKFPFSSFGEDSVENIEAHAHPLPGLKAALSFLKFFSPYQFNPFDINPLRDLLENQIDFDRLRTHCSIKLFIAATKVSTGTLKIFRNKQMSMDVLLASACLPAIHRAIEIDGEAYWDGGFTANPPIFPLLHQCSSRDIVVVLLHANPRADVPTTTSEISERLTEIGFSSTFFTELQGIALAKKEASRSFLAFGRLERRLRKLNIHLVEAKEFMSQLNSLSKLNTKAPFLHGLRDEGRKHAEVWLDKNFHKIRGAQPVFALSRFLN
jgi:NTE family protein